MLFCSLNYRFFFQVLNSTVWFYPRFSFIFFNRLLRFHSSAFKFQNDRLVPITNLVARIIVTKSGSFLKGSSAQKSLDEIKSEANKFVTEWGNIGTIQGHAYRIPLDNDYFSKDILIIVEKTRFVEVQVPPSVSRIRKPFVDLSRSSKFAAGFFLVRR